MKSKPKVKRWFAVLLAAAPVLLPAAPLPVEEGVDYEALVRRAVQYGSTPERRADKSEALALINEHPAESLNVLMHFAHIKNLGIHVLIDNLVSAMEGRDAARVLIDFLDSEHADTRKYAAWFLGYHFTPQFADKVMPLVEDEKARGAAIRTLGKWKERSMLVTVAAFLEDDKERIRVAAANALRDIGDLGALPFLEEAREDRFFTVRMAVERAIRELEEKPGTPGE